MSDLPKGWCREPLEQIADIKLGKMLDKAKNKGELYPYLRNVNVRWGDIELSDLLKMPFLPDELDTYCIQDGDLFICEGGEPGRSAVWRRGQTSVKFQKAIHRVRFEDGMTPEFFAAELRYAAAVGNLDELFVGTTIKHLTRQVLAARDFPVPPPEEQRRIVAKLDALEASAKRARAELDRIPTLVARAKQAILTKAFRGDLTADFRLRYMTEAPRSRHAVSEEVEQQRRRAWNSWLEEQGSNRSYCAADAHEWTPDYVLPTGWHWFSVDELCAAAQYGSSAKTDDNCAGVPVLRMGNIQYGALQFTNLKFLPSEHREFPSLLLKEGDLLFNRTNSAELVGKSAVFEGFPYPCSFASYLIRLRPAAYSSKLLAAYINSEIGRSWIKTVVSQQVGQANVNGTKLGRLGVPYMPEAEQAEIVRRIEAAFAKIDRIAAEAASARALLDRLDQAILAKAFRGELVPQDPSDEPAEKLLAKIKAARAAPPARKTRKKQS